MKSKANAQEYRKKFEFSASTFFTIHNFSYATSTIYVEKYLPCKQKTKSSKEIENTLETSLTTLQSFSTSFAYINSCSYFLFLSLCFCFCFGLSTISLYGTTRCNYRYTSELLFYLLVAVLCVSSFFATFCLDLSCGS